jgi:hypothetical protein
MMQGSELRIGNWVEVAEIQTVILVVSDTLFQVQGNMVTNRPNQLDPIRLTPELLEKCDFTKGEPISKGYYIPYSSNQYSNFIINYCPSNNSFWLNGYVYDVKIEFLHHLQNIYHALIGQELQVNL